MEMTKEMFDALLVATEKSTTQMVTVAGQLNIIVSNQTKILGALGPERDTMKHDIINSIVGHDEDGVKTTLTSIKKDTVSVRNDIKMSRLVITAAVLIAVAASVIANLLLRQFQDRDMISKIAQNSAVNAEAVRNVVK